MEGVFQAIKYHIGFVGSAVPTSVFPRIKASSVIKNELDQKFMYTQLLKEILITMDYDQAAKTKLVEHCRKIYMYTDDVLQMSLIDEFNQDYTKDLAIFWYNKESFLYSTLNRALRTQDIETILKMGFFSRDLHEMIVDMHAVKSSDKEKFTVYRGQVLAYEEFKKVKTSVGGLLSFNSFLSTSLDENTSIRFAKNTNCAKDFVRIMYRMEGDPKKSSIPYASVTESAVKGESEVLFSMNTVFKIKTAPELIKDYFLIDLMLTTDKDPQLQILTDYFREEIKGDTPLDQLGHLMLKMGEYSQAEGIYVPQFDTTDETNWRRQVHLNNQLGFVYNKKSDHTTALSCYEKTLHIELEFLPSDHPTLGVTYNNMASVYDSMANYATSLANYEKALEIEERSSSSDQPTIATTYSNLGLLHDKLGDFAKALAFYEKALAIREKILPPNHPDLAVVYNNIGGVYLERGDYAAALKSYEKTLAIEQKALPPKHPHLAITYCNFGLIHTLMNEESKGLEYYEKALSTRKTSLPENHPDIAHSYNIIGLAYKSKGKHGKALESLEKASAIQQKSLPENHSDFAITFNSLASVYRSMEDYTQALSYYQQALAFRERSLPVNDPDIATSYDNLGAMYRCMGDYTQAVTHYNKALEIRRASLSPTHPMIVSIYNNIGSVHHAMKEYSTALSSSRKLSKFSSKR